MNRSNPKKDRSARRVRPQYPSLEPGQAVLIEREECGTNRGRDYLDANKISRRSQTLVGEFVYKRALHP